MWLPHEEQVFGRVLSVQRPISCPELALWLVDGQVDLNACCEPLMNGGYAPYWAFCWGAGQALARFLLDHAEWVRDRRVVDFGAGCGVAGLSALLAGARSVTAVDTDPRALTACGLNAQLNGLRLEVASEVPVDWDVLIGSDVLYEVGVRDYLLSLRGPGRCFLIADPRRPGHPRLELEPLASYEVRCLPDVDYPVREAAIYAL